MRLKTGRSRDTYLELVRRFPLVPIKTPAQYAAALDFLKTLAIQDEHALDEGQTAYLEALTQFVGDFEERRYRHAIGRMKPLAALKYLMKANGMKPVDLGRVLGSRSMASQVLLGRRGLSKAHIRALSERFRVEPGLFFEGR